MKHWTAAILKYGSVNLIFLMSLDSADKRVGRNISWGGRGNRKKYRKIAKNTKK